MWWNTHVQPEVVEGLGHLMTTMIVNTNSANIHGPLRMPRISVDDVNSVNIPIYS